MKKAKLLIEEPVNILIDGDILVYRVASAIEEPIHWGEGWWGIYGDATEGCQQLDWEIHKLLQEVNDIQGWRVNIETASQFNIQIALSSSTNWRTEVLPTYKQNRANKPKPVLWNPLREYLLEKYNALVWNNLEADDVIGILASPKTIVISDDKDFQNCPCLLYRPMKKTLTKVTRKTAIMHHLMQTLTGDSADGYSGCPQVGPVKAKEILQEGTWQEVVGAYEHFGLGEEDALVQSRVAYILQKKSEYQNRTGKVKLWLPIKIERISKNAYIYEQRTVPTVSPENMPKRT